MASYKVVYNRSYGGFSISNVALELLKQRGINTNTYCTNIPRHHPELVAIVEILGRMANSDNNELEVKTVSGPYIIDEYDGLESVLQKQDIKWIDPTNNDVQSPLTDDILGS
jgi:hypothetical protein